MARLNGVLMIEQGGRGGVADYHMALSAALARQGWEVEVVTAHDHVYRPAPGRRDHGLFFYLRDRGPLNALVRRSGLSKIVNVLGFVTALPRMYRLARGCQVAHLQATEAVPLTVLAMLTLRLARRPFAYTPHNTFERGRHQLASLHAFAYRLAGAIVVHSRYDLDALPPSDRSKAHVIPHGEYTWLAQTGAPADRAAARREVGLGPTAPVTLLFGQLRADKGLRDLLLAARELDALHVILAGQDLGGLAEVAPLLEDPALSARVTLREGFLPMDEAARLFAAADIVALPYARASASGVLLLAYGFERAVVAYPVGALAEYVEDGETGWLCAAADPAALVAALRDVIAAGPDECLRRGVAARRFSDERFSWDRIAETTAGLYRRLIEAGGG